MTYGWNETYDVNTTETVEAVLKYEKPNFVVVTGDMVHPRRCTLHPLNETSPENRMEWFKNKWNIALDPIRKANIRYSIVFGNHDYGCGVGVISAITHDQKSELSYTQIGPTELGGGNISFFKYTII